VSRFDQIKTLHQDGYSPIVNSLVMCLTADEAIAALDMTFEGSTDLRRMVSRKIRTDMEVCVRNEHLALIDQLQAIIPNLKPAERAKCVTVLFDLVSALPAEVALNRLLPLLTSDYKRVRTRVLDWFKRSREAYSDSVRAAWAQFHDFEAVRLMVDHAPLEIVTESFDELEADCLAAGWLLSRLYLRYDGKPPATLKRLKEVDAVTYLYVSAKMGVRASDDELFSIYQQHRDEERSGLVVWCAGRMGAWDALMRMAESDRLRWTEVEPEAQGLPPDQPADLPESSRIG
jgi:hypothetical protein